MSITLDKIGRRHYLRGTPFAARDLLSANGCNWDPAERAWWTGKADIAEALLARLAEDSKAAAESPDTVGADDRVLRGRASYKGKSYYLLVHGEKSGRPYARLCARDGSFAFWVKDFAQLTITTRYEKPRSISELRQLAQQYKAREKQHGCGCWCHGGRYCECPGFCAFHHDGCTKCGCDA